MTASSDEFNDPISEMLSEADARVLDLLVESGMEIAQFEAAPGVTADDRVRAKRLLAQFALLDQYPDLLDADERSHGSGVDAETLIAATLARVEQADSERGRRMRLDPARDIGVRRGIRMGDLVAVASIAILATTILVPLLNWRNSQAIETKCSNNLRMIAQGLEAYGQDYRTMPMLASIVPDLGNWLGYRNADNLNVLASQKYCPDGCMSCPGDHEPNACFSYHVASEGRHPMWNLGPRMVVVGDRNPLVDLKRHGETVASVTLNAASHGGRGQNMLFTDGSVIFNSSPYIADPDSGVRDNVWLPLGDALEGLTRAPGPKPQVDAFLLH